jgi:DNA-binding transcriptional ArsR family regulator
VATYQGQFEALADATRRSIFELLGEGPRSVAEIAAAVPISRPAVSQHLKVLKAAQLVDVRPFGTRRIYSVDPRGLAAVRAYFERFWTGALGDFARAVTESSRDDHVPPDPEEQQ